MPASSFRIYLVFLTVTHVFPEAKYAYIYSKKAQLQDDQPIRSMHNPGVS